jgi:hypothetical protein
MGSKLQLSGRKKRRLTMQIMLGGTVIVLPDSLRGPLEDFAIKVNGAEGTAWEEYFKKMLRKELIVHSPEMGVGRAVKEPEPQPILRFLDTIALPARMEKFFPKKSYVVNTKRGSHVKIAYVDPDFTTWFGDKVEEPAAEATLRRHVLIRPSVFAPAMKEVEDGGFVTETTPGQLFSMLERQPNGPKSDPGPLLTNGYANLFKMIDVNGVPRLVYAFWYGGVDGWVVDASDASFSYPWRDEGRLFSGDSRLPSAA